MNQKNYDNFYIEFIKFLIKFDLSHSKEFKKLNINEVSIFEKKNHIIFDNSLKSYLKILGKSFRRNLKFREFYSIDLGGIEKAISRSLNNDLPKQILNIEKNGIDGLCEMKKIETIQGKIIPINYFDYSGYCSFIEQGKENPLILGIFNGSAENDDDYLLSDNCNIVQSIRHGVFMAVYYHFVLGKESDLSFSKLVVQDWVKAIGLLVGSFKNQILKWRCEFYSIETSRGSLDGIDFFENEFLKFIYSQKDIIEIQKYIKEE